MRQVAVDSGGKHSRRSETENIYFSTKACTPCYVACKRRLSYYIIIF